MPRVASGVAHKRPQVADVVVEPSRAVVPARSLTRRLQVFASAAAVPVVPAPLIDGVAEFTFRKRQLFHLGPNKEGRAPIRRRAADIEELQELYFAKGFSGRVVWVELQFARATFNLAAIWVMLAP